MGRQMLYLLYVKSCTLFSFLHSKAVVFFLLFCLLRFGVLRARNRESGNNKKSRAEREMCVRRPLLQRSAFASSACRSAGLATTGDTRPTPTAGGSKAPQPLSGSVGDAARAGTRVQSDERQRGRRGLLMACSPNSVPPVAGRGIRGRGNRQTPLATANPPFPSTYPLFGSSTDGR